MGKTVQWRLPRHSVAFVSERMQRGHKKRKAGKKAGSRQSHADDDRHFVEELKVELQREKQARKILAKENLELRAHIERLEAEINVIKSSVGDRALRSESSAHQI
ncbi:MAG TPA: hypothetical protein VHA37_05650 [Candidatus Saccharimonadales bacterium]|nr:hypothetical protein [Candidatus Saccharimonadales bacterium]